MSDSIQTSVWLGKSLAVVFARVALFDLCRVSFVERDSSGKCGGGDGVVKRHCLLFDRYVQQEPQYRDSQREECKEP